jgi:hypothetical protein
VNFDAVPVMGGVKDERRPARGPSGDNVDGPAPTIAEPPSTEPQAGPQPRLVLRGFVMMGGLVIRS